MDLLTYVIIAFIYIMITHLAIGIKDDFNLFLTAGIFCLGAALGAYLDSYFFGFGVAVVLSLIFW